MAKILIVDDAIFMRKMLSDILTKDGHEIVGEAENAKEAVTLFKKLKPDLVTLDIVMPEVDGMTAMRAIRDIVSTDQKAIILMVSAMGQEAFVVESIQAGAKDFIVKPFQPQTISTTVKRLLENRKASASVK